MGFADQCVGGIGDQQRTGGVPKARTPSRDSGAVGKYDPGGRPLFPSPNASLDFLLYHRRKSRGDGEIDPL